MQEMDPLGNEPVILVSTGALLALVSLMSFPELVPINKVVEVVVYGETLNAVALEVKLATEMVVETSTFAVVDISFTL